MTNSSIRLVIDTNVLVSAILSPHSIQNIPVVNPRTFWDLINQEISPIF